MRFTRKMFSNGEKDDASRKIGEWMKRSNRIFVSLSKSLRKTFVWLLLCSARNGPKQKKRSVTVPMTLYRLIVSAIRQFIQNKINYYCQTHSTGNLYRLYFVGGECCGGMKCVKVSPGKVAWSWHKIETRTKTLRHSDRCRRNDVPIWLCAQQFSTFLVFPFNLSTLYVLVRAPSTSYMWKMKMNTRRLPSNGNCRSGTFKWKSCLCVHLARNIRNFYIELNRCGIYFKRSTRHGNWCDTKRRFAHENERFCPQDWLWILVVFSNFSRRCKNLKKKRFSFFKLFVTKVTDH